MATPRELIGRRGVLRLEEGPPRRGGQAEIFRARDASGRTVAVKVAHAGAAEAQGLRTEREALAAIARRQPTSAHWLVELLDQGETPDGRPFLVLPWYEFSMQTWLNLRRPGLLARLEALELAAEAVVQLHRSAASLAGVVLHRDLKPGNFLVEERPEGVHVVLADLGGAKERKLYGATHNTGIHTPWFAPLEQMLPLERPPDPSVDVHALAVMTFVVLTGRPPQAVISRPGLLTGVAEQLLSLQHSDGLHTPEEQARYATLRRAPLERLVELGHGVALGDDDVGRLRGALTELLQDRGAAAEGIATALTDILAPTLRHALELDPSRRLSRPETLLAALDACSERLGRRRLVALVEETATSATPPITPSEAARRPPATAGRPEAAKRARALALVGVLAASSALVVCAGLGAAWWLNLRLDPTQQTASATALEDPANGKPEPESNQYADISNSKLEHAGASTATAPPAAATVQAPGSGVDPPSSAVSEPAPEKSTQKSTVPSPAASPAPLTVIFSVPADAGATATVDGSPLGSILRTGLSGGRHEVALRAGFSSAPRRFTLILEPVSQEAWGVTLRDAEGAPDQTTTWSASKKLKVRWDQDGQLRLLSSSSDL